MSQRNVEMVIGRLVTDEGFRRRFADARNEVLREIVNGGFELNPCETRALLALDPQQIAQFAARLDPCIQKVEIGRGWDLAPPERTERSSEQGDEV